MKLLEIQYHSLAIVHHVVDDADAVAAHSALKMAMEAWKEFGNERQQLLTVKFDGSEYTFRIGAIAALGLVDCAKAAATMIERDVWSDSVKRRTAERLASELVEPRTGEGEAG